ncbi:MAG: hypothetical protein A2277_20185 [Desulfobacterales bacterium RIFOXYA12_FULL_46_15]|nr:MAG: hypothetical protein A2277_20185 [Desulfobacterales bacterium RIFOXYA12_FULL_46_15]
MISALKLQALVLGVFSFFFLTILPQVFGMEGLSFEFKATALAGINGLSGNSVLNPGNRFARLPDQESNITLKPDMSFACEDWLFYAKPRLEVSMENYEINGESDDVFDKNADIPEFMVRRKLTESLFVSYGRENLQWGPGFLYSPSNPFFNDNGKKSLVQDLDGKGMLKLIMVHDEAFAASLIYNTDKGTFNEPDFEKTLAMKIDYSGDTGYASLVISHTDHGKSKLGGFAGTTLTDALIVYGETSIQKETETLYPAAVPGPLTRDMTALKNNGDLYAVLLLGATYTLESGDSLCLEYLYYGDGLDFLRQNYIMLQYLIDDVMGSIDLVSRATVCLDDGSSRLYAALSRELNDHMELKLGWMVNTGGTDDSFRTYLDYQVQAALEYTY